VVAVEMLEYPLKPAALNARMRYEKAVPVGKPVSVKVVTFAPTLAISAKVESGAEPESGFGARSIAKPVSFALLSVQFRIRSAGNAVTAAKRKRAKNYIRRELRAGLRKR